MTNHDSYNDLDDRARSAVEKFPASGKAAADAAAAELHRLAVEAAEMVKQARLRAEQDARPLN